MSVKEHKTALERSRFMGLFLLAQLRSVRS